METTHRDIIMEMQKLKKNMRVCSAEELVNLKLAGKKAIKLQAYYEQL